MQEQVAHHIHLRKRFFKNIERYPHPKKVVRLVDRGAYFFGIITPFFTIPQLYEIFQKQSAEGVSLITWGTFTISSVFWICYGVIHKETPIIISQILWTILQLLIVMGILIYR